MFRFMGLLVLLVISIAFSAGCRDDQKATIPTGCRRRRRNSPTGAGMAARPKRPRRDGSMVQ
jgi:hypothetical protein